MGALSGCAATTGVPASRTVDRPDPDTSQIVFIDGPVYESVKQITADSALTFVGHFIEHTDSVRESELINSPVDGLSFDLWTFFVDGVIHGDGALPGQTIRVSRLAVEADGAVRPATPGGAAILSLNPYRASSAFSIVGLGAGAFHIGDDGSLRATSGVDPSLRADVERFTLMSLREHLSHELN